MRAINHTVTGAVIGAAVASPLALPLALLSHIVLDVIPHSGGPDKKSQRFKIELLLDMALSASFLLAIVLLQPYNWLLFVACGVLGAAPDLWWLPYWIWELQGKPRKLDKVGSFLSRIQWSEKPWGYIVEAAWLVSMLSLFFSITA